MKVITLGVACAISISSVHAAVAYNTFTASNGFNSQVGAMVSCPLSLAGAVNGIGVQFTSLSSGPMTKVTVAAGYLASVNSIRYTLYSDSGFNTTAKTLATWTLESLNPFGIENVVRSVTPSPTATLVTGAKYWLVATAPTATCTVWNFTAPISTSRGMTITSAGMRYHAEVAQCAYRIETGQNSVKAIPSIRSADDRVGF